jgi:hypothetical protein
VVGLKVPVMNAPGEGVAKVLGNALETGIMDFCRCFAKLCKHSDSIANVRVNCNIHVQEFAKELIIGKTHVILKGGMFCRVFGPQLLSKLVLSYN